MKSIWILIQKDFLIFLKSPFFWVIAGLSASVWSYNFISLIAQFIDTIHNTLSLGTEKGGNLHWGVVAQHFFVVHFVLILLIPAITMKSLSEEKKTGTYSLLLSSPITSTQIILSKFILCFSLVLLLIFFSCSYLVWLEWVSNIEWGSLWSSILGLILTVGLYVSVGIFASSLTSSQIVALVLALISNLFILLLGDFSYNLDSGFLKDIFEHISLESHFLSFLRGVPQVKGIVFFLSGISFFLFLSQRGVEINRWR